MTDVVEVFVPGHVTGLFSVHRTDEPARTGSRGAGLTLSDGVTVRLEPADERAVELDGRTIAVDPVDHVLDTLGVEARVSAASDLPVGSGFGVSGAMALGTAYAANAAFGCGRSDNALVRVAHEAEVASGTGLGDVVAQARGGAPIRLEPGAPPYGRLDGIPETGRVEYLTFGGVSTAEVITGSTDVLSAAGEKALDRLVERPTLPRFVAASRQFAREADLLTADVARVLDDVEDASMAMLGETVFALGTSLSDAGYDVETCEIHPAGATFR